VRPCAHLLGHEAKNAYPSGDRLDIHICTQQGCHVPKSLVREIRPHHGNASRKVNEKKVSALTEKYTENIYENWKYLLCTKRPQEPAYEELPVVATTKKSRRLQATALPSGLVDRPHTKNPETLHGMCEKKKNSKSKTDPDDNGEHSKKKAICPLRSLRSHSQKRTQRVQSTQDLVSCSSADTSAPAAPAGPANRQSRSKQAGHERMPRNASGTPPN
jgi:hypothetical protein